MRQWCRLFYRYMCVCVCVGVCVGSGDVDWTLYTARLMTYMGHKDLMNDPSSDDPLSTPRTTPLTVSLPLPPSP